MGFSFSDLLGNRIEITICDKEFELSLITIEKHLRIVEMCGSINNLFEHFKKENLALLDFVYMLIKDKTDLSKSDYYNLYLKTPDKIELGKQLQIKIQQIIKASYSEVREKSQNEIDMEILNSAVSGDNDKCIGKAYDLLAKRYGYTLQDFSQLTLKQLDILLEVCSESVVDEFDTQAALHGRKTKPRMKVKKTEKKEDEALDKMMKEIYEKQKLASKGNSNGK